MPLLYASGEVTASTWSVSHTHQKYNFLCPVLYPPQRTTYICYCDLVSPGVPLGREA